MELQQVVQMIKILKQMMEENMTMMRKKKEVTLIKRRMTKAMKRAMTRAMKKLMIQVMEGIKVMKRLILKQQMENLVMIQAQY